MVQDFLASRGLDIKDNRIPQLVSVDTEDNWGVGCKTKKLCRIADDSGPAH